MAHYIYMGKIDVSETSIIFFPAQCCSGTHKQVKLYHVNAKKTLQPAITIKGKIISVEEYFQNNLFFPLCIYAHHHNIPVKKIKAAFIVSDEFKFIVAFSCKSLFFYLLVYIPLQEIMSGIVFFF